MRFNSRRYAVWYTKNTRVRRWYSYSISQRISNSTRNMNDVAIRTSLQKICSVNSFLQLILPVQHKCCYTMQSNVSAFHVDGTFYMHTGHFKEFHYQYLCIASVCYFEHALVLPFHLHTLHVQNTFCSQWGLQRLYKSETSKITDFQVIFCSYRGTCMKCVLKR